MIRKGKPSGVFTRVLVLFRISDTVISSATIAITTLTLGTCVFYALALLLGGFHGRVRQIVYLLVALILIRLMSPIMVQATSEEGLENLKSNRAFEFMLLLAKIMRNCLAGIVLFRLALFAGVLFSDNGVAGGFTPLWHILRQVILG